MIENLQNLLNAGDELRHFSGILSGSLSFIFGKLDEGVSFSAATAMAREMGYTEPIRATIYPGWMWRVNC